MLARNPAEDNDQGFSLVELLVVIIVIGVLAGIAIPIFLNQRKKGYDTDAKNDLRNAATAQEAWVTEKNAYTLNQSGELQTMGFRSAVPGATLTVVSTRTNTGIAVAPAVGSASYCMRSLSQSGTTFYYDSANGGLSTAACA